MTNGNNNNLMIVGWHTIEVGGKWEGMGVEKLNDVTI